MGSRENWKAKALTLDRKAYSKQRESGGDQWLIYDGAGELIGWSESPERSSYSAWMRAYYSLRNRKAG